MGRRRALAGPGHLLHHVRGRHLLLPLRAPALPLQVRLVGLPRRRDEARQSTRARRQHDAQRRVAVGRLGDVQTPQDVQLLSEYHVRRHHHRVCATAARHLLPDDAAAARHFHAPAGVLQVGTPG